jgi:hypothetical protein
LQATAKNAASKKNEAAQNAGPFAFESARCSSMLLALGKEHALMSSDDLATRLMDDIDPRLLEFIRTKVNSFIKWDLVRFFHDNPHTTDTAESIARYTGRDVRTIEPELLQLVSAGVLQKAALNELTVYTLATDTEIRTLINTFILACDDRQFRVKAIYHVIRGMR